MNTYVAYFNEAHEVRVRETPGGREYTVAVMYDLSTGHHKDVILGELLFNELVDLLTEVRAKLKEGSA